MWERVKHYVILMATIWTLVSSASIRRNDLDVDINKTLQNVQEILEANPSLPRLSADEILTLLNNITAEDKIKHGISVQYPLDSSNGKDEEKIMVVLPYQPTKAGDDMTELYTKRPITKIVSTNPSNVELTTTIKYPHLYKQLSEVIDDADNKYKKNKLKKATSTIKSEEVKDLIKSDQSDSSSQKNSLASFNYELMNQQSVDTSQIAFPDISAYEFFKPIPSALQSDENIPPHIKSILESISDSLQIATSAKKETVPNNFAQQSNENAKFEYVDPDTFPAEMTSLLTDLGLTKTNGRFADAPNVSQTHNKARKMSLENLEIQSNGKDQLAVGPDPLSVDEVQHVEDDLGNDLAKRQQSENSTEPAEVSSTASTTTESSETTKASEDASEGPNIADLENSFGASNADDDPSEAELPPPRKNGFYYMLDWNSFLEVGDGDTKVNIRFDPKLGDPQRFVAVNVP